MRRPSSDPRYSPADHSPSRGVDGRRVEEVFRGAFPYVIAMLAVALLFLMFPGIVLWIPETM